MVDSLIEVWLQFSSEKDILDVLKVFESVFMVLLSADVRI